MPHRALLPAVATLFSLSVVAFGAPLTGAGSLDPVLAEIRRLYDEGRYAQAKELAEPLLARVEAEFGTESAETATVLDELVRIAFRGGERDRPETLARARRAVEIRERAGEIPGAALASSLHNLAALLHNARMDLDGALKLYARSLAIRRALSSEPSAEVAQSLAYLGDLYLDQGDLELAQRMVEESLDLRHRVLGEVDRAVAESLNFLGTILWARGDYAASKASFERALDIRESVLRPGHPLIGRSWHNVGVLAFELGEVDEALVRYERALELRSAELGPLHPEVGSTHNALAETLQETGDFAAAQEHFRAALECMKQGYGEDHPRYADSLRSLALLLAASGDYEEAAEILLDARDLFRRAHGEGHPDSALTAGALGGVLVRMGDLETGLDLLLESSRRQESILGPDHADLAETSVLLGEALFASGRFDEAGEACRRAVRIYEALDPWHPRLIRPLLLCAALSGAAPETAGGQSPLTRAREIVGRALDAEHPLTARLTEALALERAVRGDRLGAVQAGVEAQQLATQHAESTLPVLSGRRSLALTSNLRGPISMALGLLESEPRPLTGPLLEAVWDEWIRARALSLEEMVSRHRAIYRAADPEVGRLFEAWATARTRLSNLMAERRSALRPQERAARLRNARREAERLEEELAARSAAIRRERSRRRVRLADVRAALPPGDSLVAFVRYERRAPGLAGLFHRPGEGEERYAAFLLPPGSEPTLLPLGPASPIDSLVAGWREAVMWPSRNGTGEPEHLRAGNALRRAIWDPVAALLGIAASGPAEDDSPRRVFIVPDGSLNLINWVALPTDSGGFLIESGLRVHLLSAERTLVADHDRSPEGAAMLAVGGVDFDRRASSLTADDVHRSMDPADARGAFRGVTPRCRSFESLRFLDLPASRLEVEELAPLWWRQAAPGGAPTYIELTGAFATEEAFKRLASGKRVLHLATHGFFVNGICDPVEVGARSAAGRDDWLRLSGLALAGANHRRRSAGDQEDGILTAEEVAALDLSAAEWVVLSGCETGVGSIRAGEGVLGLRRAFEIAGARSLILSLWMVDDEGARAWMRSLYEARFVDRLDVIESVHRASSRSLERLRESGRSDHPAGWGGFVASGDWR